MKLKVHAIRDKHHSLCGLYLAAKYRFALQIGDEVDCRKCVKKVMKSMGLKY